MSTTSSPGLPRRVRRAGPRSETRLKCVAAAPEARLCVEILGEHDTTGGVGVTGGVGAAGGARGVVLTGPEVTIGRGAGCSLVLPDPTVSEVHLVLRVEDGAIRVIDAGGRGGVWLDGVRVRDAYARPDAVVGLGRSRLRLRGVGDEGEAPSGPRSRLGGLLGVSPAMQRVFALLERAARTDATVLLEGETGTGKELAAQALHEESPRAGGVLQVVDCSALSATMIEDMLFGHVRGAFTGAIAEHPGGFEEADGGTLFLDEIGELPLELQPKLLRAIETRAICRLGSNVPRRVDVRIVAATNRSLAREVAEGRFRADLYYRLNVVRVELPPLRERPEDVQALVRHIEEGLPAASQARAPLSEDEVDLLSRRPWPGNVRELRNEVVRMHALGLHALETPTPTPTKAPAAWSAPRPGVAETGEDGEPVVDLSMGFRLARQQQLDAFERRFLAEALRRAHGNVSLAAQSIGVSRKLLHRAIARHALREVDP
ncbi:sigma 54-interacting transcriptional regulator [Chondromyces crocatus]|nr:sigma 54-interacting transcriptional regulator [Chondromyces crocatus]